MEVIVIVILILAIYFFPSIVGGGKRQGCAIFVLNLFLGWTLVGWVLALVWACCNDSNAVREYHIPIEKTSPKTSQYDELEKLADLKAKGIISEEEFAEQKKKILGTNEPKQENKKEDNPQEGN